MIVRKFEADSVTAALSEIKQKMGEEAVILHTKHYRKGMWLGLMGKQVVEITASCDQAASTHNALRPASKVNGVTHEKSSQDFNALQRELGEIKTTLAKLVKKTEYAYPTQFPDPFMSFYQHLLDQDVSEKMSQKIIEALQSVCQHSELLQTTDILEEFEKILGNLFHSSSPIQLKEGRATKVLLVGPTGVGKTTTLAKLAAHFLLKERKKVALITVDTYRIAAAEQLRVYAQIMHLPLEVVSSEQELKQAIEKHSHCDLILMDTAGRSHRHSVQMLELANWVKTTEPDEVHLVLSLASQRKNAFDVIERFQSVPFSKILFTKLDEAATLGLMLEVAALLDKPVSYVCHGQNVPEDMDEFKNTIYAKALAKGGSLVRSSLASEKISF
jgi:flagellar biosynthesis protein FlhF